VAYSPAFHLEEERLLTAWLPVAAYAALIFTFSSMATLAPPGDVTHLDKGFHLIEYGLFGALVARALGATISRAGVRIAATVAIGAAIGALDEWYQGSRGRSADPADWLADVIAVGLAAAIVTVWSRRVPAGKTES
jgi:VanZ family protein